MTRITSANAKQSFAETLRRVASRRERVIVSSQGKYVAAIVPLEDLATLEEMEDRRDLEQAKKALADARKKGEKPIPWAKAKKELAEETWNVIQETLHLLSVPKMRESIRRGMKTPVRECEKEPGWCKP